MAQTNSFGVRAKLGDHYIYRLDKLAKAGVAPNDSQFRTIYTNGCKSG